MLSKYGGAHKKSALAASWGQNEGYAGLSGEEGVPAAEVSQLFADG